MQLAIPSEPEQLNAAWITAVLRACGVLGLAEVAAIAVDDIGQGFGFTGVVVRVRLTYNAPTTGAPASVVVKLPLAQPAQPSIYRQEVDRNPAAARAHFERAAREVHFYRSFGDSAAAPFPHCYYSAAEPEQGVVLVLEDVAPARHVDALAGGTAAEAWVVLEPLAGWHARWWEQTSLNELPWLPDWGGDPDARQLRYQDRLPAFLRLFQQRLPPYAVELVVGLRERYAAVVHELMGSPFTIIHGDMNVDNVLWHAPRSGRTATIIDWQGVARGPCALDAMLFMVDTLSIAERRAAGDDLLLAYHDALVEHGVTGYAREQFLRDGKLALLQRLAGTVTWFAQAEHGSVDGRERELIDDFFERGQFLTALSDYRVDVVLRS